MADQQSQPDYIYKSTVKDTYGLPDSWIRRLGEPDKVVPNPHYRSRNSYLYQRARVEAFIEQHQDEYALLLARRARRSARAQAVTERRAHELVEWARAVEIQIGALPRHLGQLAQKATSEFLAFRALERDDYDAEFTLSANAIAAHVRHTRTNYERLLSEIEGRPGCLEAYPVLKARCNEAVEKLLADQYGGDWASRLSLPEM